MTKVGLEAREVEVTLARVVAGVEPAEDEALVKPQTHDRAPVFASL